MTSQIVEFNTSDYYYEVTQDITETLIKYKETIEKLKKILPSIDKLPPSKNNFRIMSYNVRFFTSAENDITIHGIVEVILSHYPHVICLQEMAMGENQYYDVNDKRFIFAHYFKVLLDYYQVISVCSSPPSWFTTVYGNMILVRKELLAKLQALEGSYGNLVKKFLCDFSAQRTNKCFLNQQIFVYDNVPGTESYDDEHGGIIKYQDKKNENKCFIKITLPYFDIMCVHLDAYTTNSRLLQLKKINSEITRSTIIIGDFNFFNVNDFLYWADMLQHKIFFQIIVNVTHEILMDPHKKISQIGTYNLIFSNFSQKNKDAYQNFIGKLDEYCLATINNDMQDVNDNPISKLLTSQYEVNDMVEKITKYKTGKISLADIKSHILDTFFNIIITVDSYDFLKIYGFDEIDFDKNNIQNLILPEDVSPDIIKNLVSLKKIVNKLASLEKYFLNISGSIMKNAEFIYCTEELKWVTIDPKDTINISQWSGTRVDMAFFAKFPQNFNYNHYLLPIGPLEGSDHLPLVIDIKIDDVILQQTLEIDKIDTIVLEAPEHMNKSLLKPRTEGDDPCASYPLIEYISLPMVIFNQPLYNGQPIAYESFDWVLGGEFLRVDDPFVVAGTGGLLMGRLGTYVSTSLNYVFDVVHTISEANIKIFKTDPSGFFYACLLYDFSCRTSNVTVGETMGFNDKAYKLCYDDQADILMVSGYDYILKFTPNNVKRLMKLESLKICVDIISDKNQSRWMNLMQFIKPENTNKPIIKEMMNSVLKYPRVRISDTYLQKINYACLIIYNSIEKINEFSMKKYGTTFIKTIQPDRLKLDFDDAKEPYILYDIDLSNYNKSQHGGKNYYYKYIKYKMKYLNTKLTMDL